MDTESTKSMDQITEKEISILHDNFRNMLANLGTRCHPEVIESYLIKPNLADITDVMAIRLYLNKIKDDLHHLDMMMYNLTGLAIYNDQKIKFQ